MWIRTIFPNEIEIIFVCTTIKQHRTAGLIVSFEITRPLTKKMRKLALCHLMEQSIPGWLTNELPKRYMA